MSKISREKRLEFVQYLNEHKTTSLKDAAIACGIPEDNVSRIHMKEKADGLFTCKRCYKG